MTDIVEQLREAMDVEAADYIEDLEVELFDQKVEVSRLSAEHDDYVIRANANVCELNRDIERLKAQLARTETALDKEFNNGIALCAEIERLKMEAKVLK